jgi:hypothetical protein
VNIYSAWASDTGFSELQEKKMKDLRKTYLICFVFIIGCLLTFTLPKSPKISNKSAAEKYSHEEFNRMLIPVEVLENRYFELYPFYLENQELDLQNTEDLPETFDWRDYGIVSSVKNQQTGSCAVFASISIIEAQIMKYSGVEVDLSEEEISNCHPLGETSFVTSAVFEYVLKNGIVTEARYPFDPRMGQECNRPSPPDYYINDWGMYNLSYKPLAERIKIIKSLLMTYGPVDVGFWVYQDFHHYSSGVYIYDGVSEFRGGHGVSIIGWQDDGAIPNGGYWIVKNSYGQDWGEDGFFRIGYGQCEIDNNVSWVLYDPTVTAPIFKIKMGIRYAGAGHLINLDISARSNKGAEIHYYGENLPEGAVYDPLSGKFTWTPSSNQIGTHVFTFVASDGHEETRQEGTFIIENYEDD